MCGRYYVDDDTAKEIEKVIRQINKKLHAQGAEHREGAEAARTAEHREGAEAVRTAGHKEGAADICPTAFAPVIGAVCGTDGYRAADCRMLRWGLPGYARKDGKKGRIIFNARSETAMEKPTFREGIRNRRVVIPAAGFYEWNGKKEKYRFRRADSPILFMAGCMNRYEDGDRFVILTTAANESMEPVHDRMPLILESDEIEAWIWDEERTKSLLEKKTCLLDRAADYEQMTLF